MAVLSQGRAPVTRYKRETMLQTVNELFLYEEDLVHVEKPSIPIVVGFNNVKQHYVPITVVSARMYTEFKLSCVAKIAEASLSMASPVEINYVPVNLLPAYSMQYRYSFKDTHFTEATSAAAATSTASAPPSTTESVVARVTEGSIHQVPDRSGESVPPPAVPAKRKRFSRKDPSGKKTRTATNPQGKRVHVCDICGVQKERKNDYDSHMVSAHGEGFECQYCHKVLSYERNLKKHIKNLYLQEFLYGCDELRVYL